MLDQYPVTKLNSPKCSGIKLIWKCDVTSLHPKSNYGGDTANCGDNDHHKHSNSEKVIT